MSDLLIDRTSEYSIDDSLPVRHNQKWTPSDVTVLIHLMSLGTSFEVIGQALQRSTFAAWVKARDMRYEGFELPDDPPYDKYM